MIILAHLSIFLEKNMKDSYVLFFTFQLPLSSILILMLLMCQLVHYYELTVLFYVDESTNFNFFTRSTLEEITLIYHFPP